MRESRAIANATVSADTSEVILLVTGMAPGREYPVRVSAVNAAGAGPSDEAALLLAPAGGGLGGASSSGVLTHHHHQSGYSDGEVLGYTWVIALLGSLAFVLILISAVMIYYRYYVLFALQQPAVEVELESIPVRNSQSRYGYLGLGPVELLRSDRNGCTVKGFPFSTGLNHGVRKFSCFRRKNIGVVGQKSFGVYLPATAVATAAPADHRVPSSSTLPPVSAASISDFQGRDSTHKERLVPWPPWD